MDYAFLASGTYFASEGTYDFATPNWGPQDLRCVLSPPAATGMVTLYFDGEPIGYIEEAYAQADWLTYTFEPGMQVAGHHSLGLRLDEFSGGTSIVEVVNVATGLAVVVPNGDLDGDGSVGILDFLALLEAWGLCPTPCPPTCSGDLDGDCNVGIADFLILLGNWG